MTVTHRGFSAWITSEGSAVREYEVAVDEKANRVTCWIPSEEGKPFTVHWRDHGGKVDTAAFITLDGFVISGRFLFGDGEASREGIRTGPNTERPFVFRRVRDGDRRSSGKVNRKDIGTIMLRIKRIQRVASKPANPVQELPDAVHGRGDHCIGFGEEKPTWIQYPTTWTVKPYDPKNPGSYVTFIFRYRSRDFLESEGILTPESETPPKTVAGRSISSTPITPRATPSPRFPSRLLSGGIRKVSSRNPRRVSANRSIETFPQSIDERLHSLGRNEKLPGMGYIFPEGEDPDENMDEEEEG